MKQQLLSLLSLIALSSAALAQPYPPAYFEADSVQVATGGTVDVGFTVRDFDDMTNWRGTIAWDTAVARFLSVSDSMIIPTSVFAHDYSYTAGGEFVFNWYRLLTIGVDLNDGDTLFKLRFEANGAPGSKTAITFQSTPEAMYWGNTWGWSDPIVGVTGEIEITGCAGPNVDAQYTSSGTGLGRQFTNTSIDGTGGGYTFQWDFGDGNTNAIDTNPSHTFAAAGDFDVCLYTTDACGTDSLCTTITVADTSGGGGALAIAENKSIKVNIFPNPASNVLKVESGGEEGTISLISVTGESMRTEALTGELTDIDVTELAPGIYLAQVRVGQRYATKRFTIRR